MPVTTDLVAAVTLPELSEGLAVASRLGRYLPKTISEEHPDITSLMFSLQHILNNPPDSDPVVIVYDPSTSYFLAEDEIEQLDPKGFIKAVTVQPGGRLVFHGIIVGQ